MNYDHYRLKKKVFGMYAWNKFDKILADVMFKWETSEFLNVLKYTSISFKNEIRK